MTIISLQIVFLILGLASFGYLTIKTVIRIMEDGETYIDTDVEFDWLSVSKKLLVLATCFNLLSFTIILCALIRVKKWIDEEFDGQRRWRCHSDGLFLIYLILLTLISIVEIGVMIWLLLNDFANLQDQLFKWQFRDNDRYFKYF